MPRAVLLGMNNPLSLRPQHALFPHPPGCTGWRLWQMLRERTGASRGEYLRAFDRRNLVNGVTWRAAEAREAVEDMVAAVQGREVVVLGEGPRAALGIPRLLIHPQEWRGATWRQVPHPSGRNLWYNDETCRSMVGMLLEELYERGDDDED